MVPTVQQISLRLSPGLWGSLVARCDAHSTSPAGSGAAFGF